jgi:photosystem II oxygen-evolving enhancer protein 2
MQVKDTQDGYAFLYPFGWQEIAVDGQDVVYKDVIEPLESVSVSMVPTDKTDIAEYGPLADVVLTLADKVLTGPTQEVKIVAAAEVGERGRGVLQGCRERWRMGGLL